MAGKVKKLERSEGATVTPASDLSIPTGATERFVTHANEAAYVAAKGSAAADGDAFYDTTEDVVKLYAAGAWEAIGSGAGGINYISQTNAAAYNDGASDKPVDGDGGAPINITFDVANTSSPLIGPADVKISKDAANRQGQGISWDFSIDTGAQAQPCTIEFYYSATTNFGFGDFTDPASNPSDLVFYIYDVTNAQLIQPAPFTIHGGGYAQMSFQSASNSLSYRLIAHIATTNATAWDFQIDNIIVSPNSGKATGPAVKDTTNYTPTLSWTTNIANNAAKYWRFADRLYVSGNVEMNGAADAADLTISLPSSWAIDTAKIDANTDNAAIGVWSYADGGVRETDGLRVLYNTTTTIKLTKDDTVASQTAPITWASGDEIWYQFSVPIAGWSSNTIISDSTDNRAVCFFNRTATPTGTIGPTYNDIVYGSAPVVDTHNAYNTSTGIWTCPVAGYYDIGGQIAVDDAGNWLVTEQLIIAIEVNGSVKAQGNEIAPGANTKLLSDVNIRAYPLNVGDTVNLASYSTGVQPPAQTYTTSGTENHFSISKVSGPSAIAATEVVAARRNGDDVAQTFNDNVFSYVNFVNNQSDTHSGWVAAAGAWNAASGSFATTQPQYSIPTSGYYDINACVAVATGPATDLIMQIRKNTTTVAEVVSKPISQHGSVIPANAIKCDAGDLIDVRINWRNGAGSTALSTTDNRTYFNINRIGGVV